MKINELIKDGRKILKDIDYYEYFALFKDIFEGLTGKAFYKFIDGEIEENLTYKILDAIQMYKNGYPVQYIINSVNFMGFNLYIKEGVFIPRPETENLVEYALKGMKDIKNPFILDLCTGSGAIAIAIAMFRKDAYVLATDISYESIMIASKNIEKYRLNDRVLLIQGDLFNPIKKKHIFDAILSNPPYIPSERISSLSEHVKKEPTISLDGKEDGNYYVNEIINKGSDYIKKKGFIIVETDSVNIVMKDEKIKYEFLNDFRGMKRFIKCEVL